MTIFKDKNILIGISGGIAAYKAAEITSSLIKLGASVKIIMTENAAKFIQPLTFESLSGNLVYTNTFQKGEKHDIDHIALAKWADLFLIAPATANVISKAANGIADDLLTTTILATEAATIIAPAMNTVMYNKAIIQENIDKLKNMGYIFIPPGRGRLACGDWGEGKLADVGDIVQALENKLYEKDDLLDKRVIVTAGPTLEAIDPVRFISNHSSGKMGYSLALAAMQRGAKVDLVTGPTNIDPPKGINVHKVNSAIEMRDEVLNLYDDADIIFKVAAVADYRPKSSHSKKIKKTSSEMILELEQNPDILLELGKKKKKQILVGFAAETNNLEDYALKKLKEKNLDYILANLVGKEQGGFASDDNEGVLYSNENSPVKIPMLSKKEFAHRIIDEIVKKL